VERRDSLASPFAQSKDLVFICGGKVAGRRIGDVRFSAGKTQGPSASLGMTK
jgi:hypothetical protein